MGLMRELANPIDEEDANDNKAEHAASASPSDGKRWLVAEIRQAIVTMRRIAGTPSIRRRALTDCQQLDYRASKLEDALKAAGG